MDNGTKFDVDTYLSRMSVARAEVQLNREGLELLQRQHLRTIPFENLDIHWKRPISLEVDSLYEKVVGQKRGGFCYELNGLFNELLRSLGFQTRLVSARVAGPDGSFSPEYDHAAVIVTIGDDEYLTDVGFGEFAAGPLVITAEIEQTDDTGIFRIRQLDDGYLDVDKRQGSVWKPEYMFMPIERNLPEFGPRCEFQQYSPDSHFLKGKICSIMTETGRKTLQDSKFIITENGRRSEIPVDGEAAFNEVLLREFDIKRT
jgi:N-hydroxyarylamine O-acetyltransferase